MIFSEENGEGASLVLVLQPRLAHFIELRLDLRHPLELGLELAPEPLDDLPAPVEDGHDLVVLLPRHVDPFGGGPTPRSRRLALRLRFLQLGFPELPWDESRQQSLAGHTIF